MNDLEKKSFYSFLALYIVSSFIFISLIGFWYYAAQKHSKQNETHYKLEHLADKKSGEIIVAHMHSEDEKKIAIPKDVSLALINTQGEVTEGKLVKADMKIEAGYFIIDDYNVLISDAPREHLNTAYVVLQSNTLKTKLQKLKKNVLIVMGIAFFIVMIIGWMLSKIFMRPLRERVAQIERFINDVTHELNTPITSLSMSTNQALKTGNCTEKTLNNISISTKQLYDIYRSLTYINFSKNENSVHSLDIDEVLKTSISYYRPLAEMKKIIFAVEIEPTTYVMVESQMTLLLGNIIGNAIKYSSSKSTINITLKNRTLSIKDEGIGIALHKQREVFDKFKRGTEYSGGFGVGLNIVKSICSENNILLELNSKLDVGTEIKLTFPA